MTAKERLLAVLRGETPDQISWSPNLAYWWEAQDDDLIQMGEVEFCKQIGADPLIRGHYPMYDRNWDSIFVYDKVIDNCEIRETGEPGYRKEEYITPVGILTFGHKYVESAKTWFLVEHPVKEEEDFKTLTYIMEHTRLIPNSKRFDAEAARYGGEALLVPLLSPELKSSFQSLLEKWVGTEELVYALMDYPETVEETLAAMQRVSMDAARVCAASGAEVFLTWEDTSTTNISPAYYRDYILPEINGWCDILHDAGKLYIQHACGHLKDLMPLMAQSKIDCIESISPPPTGNIEIWDAREALPGHITLIGGIEPTIFESSAIEDFTIYVQRLVERMQGTRYVLANSDSCPPGVSLEKMYLIQKLIKTK